jgi:PadR family transcriptional regulator, regulatory protein PadR
MPRPLGITSLQILAAIRDGDAYGLEVVARTELPSGTVYPTLARLLQRELIRARWEDRHVAASEGRPRRRYYELTGQGARVLQEGVERMRRTAVALQTRLYEWAT